MMISADDERMSSTGARCPVLRLESASGAAHADERQHVQACFVVYYALFLMINMFCRVHEAPAVVIFSFLSFRAMSIA